jgi:hypothetical protein
MEICARSSFEVLEYLDVSPGAADPSFHCEADELAGK